MISHLTFSGSGSNQGHIHMKTNINATTVIPGVIVATALLLSFGSFAKADIIVGFSAVFAVVAIATLEYRLNWKRLLGL